MAEIYWNSGIRIQYKLFAMKISESVKGIGLFAGCGEPVVELLSELLRLSRQIAVGDVIAETLVSKANHGPAYSMHRKPKSSIYRSFWAHSAMACCGDTNCSELSAMRYPNIH